MTRTRTTTPDRVWFITGTSSGLGQALAYRVVECGDKLVATARSLTALEPLAREHHERVRLAPVDVTDRDAVGASVDQAITEFGRIDVVVNNAGHGAFGAIEELTEHHLRQQFEVNVFGVLNVTRAVLPHLRRQRSGHLVQMSSLNGVVGQMGTGAYAGTKFAVEGISEALADELRHLGIKVTIVEPGPFRTRFAGASAQLAEPLDDYAETVGAARDYLRQLDGNQPGDPDKAALAILRAVDADSSPLRMPLGQEAHAAIRDKLTRQLRDLDAWEETNAATAFAAA